MRKSAAQAHGGFLQKFRRDIDCNIEARCFQRVQYNLSFCCCAGAIFEQRCIASAKIRDVTRIQLQNSRLGTGWIIFVEVSNGFKKSAARVVIKPAAWQRLLPRREPLQHVSSECGDSK